MPENGELSKTPVLNHRIITITVKEFMEGDYGKKVKSGKCVVGVLFDEPKREDFKSEDEYLSNMEVFDLVISSNPTGNLQTFQECEKSGENYYVMKSFDFSGGVINIGMSGETKLLVFPRKPKLTEKNKNSLTGSLS